MANVLTPEQATFLRDFMLPYIRREHASTLKLLKALPADQLDYQPHPKAMKAFDLAWHTAASEAWAINGVLHGEFSVTGFDRPAEVTTCAALATWYDTELTGLYAKLAAADGATLAKQVNFLNVMNDSVIAYLQVLLFGHVLHHRGQLSTYVRAMGGRVPGIYGPSADEPM